MEAMLLKLRSNLSKESLDTNTSKIDIQYACDHPYHPPPPDKSLKDDLEEFKFNQKLQTISAKRQQLPNLQVTNRCELYLILLKDVNDLANLLSNLQTLSYKVRSSSHFPPLTIHCQDFIKIGQQVSSEMIFRYFTAEVFDMVWMSRLQLPSH
jgi:hypothetical protein